MKKFAFLLSAALIACSESEKIADVNDDFVAQGESSSSIEELSSATGDAPVSGTSETSSATEVAQSSSVTKLSSASEKIPSSSSSGTAVLSSGNEKQSSSSLSYLDFLNTGTPGGAGACVGYGGTGAAGGFAAMGRNDFLPDTSSLAYSPYAMIVKARAAKFISSGVAVAEAEKKARTELIVALGLDTLFRENPLQGSFAEFTRSNVEYALNYFFEHDTVTVASFITFFAEKGTLEPSEYCGIWNSSLKLTPGEGMTDLVYIRPHIWAKGATQQGCAMTGYEDDPPAYIFNNLYSKCIGLPYCDDKIYGTVKRGGLKNIISDTLYFCDTRGWMFLNNFEQDTKDVPCNQIGKVIKSSSLSERYYICKEGGWQVASKMDYETQDITCGASPKLEKSSTDSTRYYVCKDSKWKIANQLEIKTFNVPCDRVGKMIDNGIKDYNGQIYYICRDTGWDTATQREADIGDRACDAEGKTVKGVLDTNMSYVCYQNSWADFYDAPCDTDNKRVRDWKDGTKEDYICYNGKWNRSRNWSCEYPKEYYFNPNVQYGILTDERDGEIYRTVEYNGYTWMAENLRYATPDPAQSPLFEEGCEIAGRFYSKDAAKTACPTGWKLPDSVAAYSLRNGSEHLSGYLSSCFNQQLVSQIGSICSGYECNAIGTSFLPLGSRKNPNSRSGPENSMFWAYDNRNPGEVKIFKIASNYLTYYSVDDDFVPIRCIKE